MVFRSGIWYGKLIFLKIIFKANFIHLKNVICIYIYIYSGIPLAGPPTGLHSIGHVSGAAGWGGHVTLAFIKVSRIIAITSFLQFFPLFEII